MVSTESQVQAPPFYRDVKKIRIIAQIAAFILVAAFIWYEIQLTSGRLSERGLTSLTDFSFLNTPTRFEIPQSGRDSSEAIWKGIVYGGIKNTLLVVIVGIPFSLILGTLIGIMRLSSNWLLSKIATVYVETLRNIPPLLVILFFSLSVIVRLPLMKDAATPLNVVLISRRFFGVATPMRDGNLAIYLAILGFAFLGAVWLAIHRIKLAERTGAKGRPVLYALGLFLGIGAIAYIILGAPFVISYPEVTESGLNVTGGLRISQQYASVTLALIIYTASHIAEIVRGSIQAVHKGQNEAAEALALSGFQRYWFVILPQAFRIAIPPLINQMLNLTKNSSLALAVGYMEITTFQFTLIGNSNPAPQNIIILMGVYLMFSLTISVIANIINSRMQLVGR
jgi:general L-amino acid transport system permease protein